MNFNQSLDNSLFSLHNLRELTFGYCFNQSLDNSLSNLHNLRELTLAKSFNQPINIPECITKLTIGCNSQSIIDYLPSNIEELVFGYSFNLEFNDLPSFIKKITINNEYYDKKLNNLPTGLEFLKISTEYKETIDVRYKNLNIVKF